jgi:hypothetical protein
MSANIELKYERCTKTTIGVQVWVEGKLFLTGSVNPYRDKTITALLAGLTEKGLQFDPEPLATKILEKSLATLSGNENGQPADPQDPLSRMPQEIRDAGIELLRDPQLLLRVIDDCQSLALAGEEELICCFYLTGTSRLLPRPLATVTTGASSAGKSYVLGTVARLFPDETKFVLTSTSSKAFYYLPPDSLKHKYVVCGEQARTQTDESEDVKRVLRELLSDGEITRAVSLAKDGQIATRIFKQVGPIAYSDSTTQTNLFAEDSNRVITLHPNECDDQSRAVLLRSAASYLENTPDPGAQQRLIDVHHAAQRTLKQNRVTIPYVELIARELSVSNIDVRRALPLFLAGIEACTLLFQLQRELSPRGRLIATADDYEIVASLFTNWLTETLAGSITQSTREFYRWLCREFDEGSEITIPGCTARGRGRGQVSYHLAKLVDCGLVQQTNRGGHGKTGAYRLVVGSVAETRIGLPSVEAVRECRA